MIAPTARLVHPYISELSWRVIWWMGLLAVFLPVAAVSRDMWDGVIGAYGLERGDFSGIRDWLLPSNWGLVYLLLRGIDLLATLTGVPPWISIKLIMLLAVVGIAREARLLCTEILGWSRDDGRATELLVLTFPCWFVLYGSTFIYVLFIWCVFAGHRFLHASGWPAARIGGYLLILVSFQVNSNFVMVFALEAVRWINDPSRSASAWRRSALVCGSAVAVYLLLRLVWPPRGEYLGYNNLVWPFSLAGLATWARAAAMALTWLPWLALPALVAWLLVRNSPSAASPTAPLGGSRELVSVALLVAGGLFAYMAVGKGAPLFVVNLPIAWLGTAVHVGKAAQGWIYTTGDGWSMRNAFLFSVPASIAAVWLVRRVLANCVSLTVAKTAWRWALMVAITGNIALLANGHAAKQLRLAQEESIVRGLKRITAPPPGLVDLELANNTGWSVWTYETNYWFWLAYRRAEWAVAAYSKDGAALLQALKDREQSIRSEMPRSHFLMTELRLPDCHSAYRVELPDSLNSFSWTADRLGVQHIPPAVVIMTRESCLPLE